MHSALSGARSVARSVGGKRHVSEHVSEVSALTFADLDSTGSYEPAHCRLINDSTLTSISSSSGTLISAGWDRSLQIHAVAGVSANKAQDPAKRSIGMFSVYTAKNCVHSRSQVALRRTVYLNGTVTRNVALLHTYSVNA
jgi:hypothetical protein